MIGWRTDRENLIVYPVFVDSSVAVAVHSNRVHFNFILISHNVAVQSVLCVLMFSCPGAQATAVGPQQWSIVFHFPYYGNVLHDHKYAYGFWNKCVVTRAERNGNDCENSRRSHFKLQYNKIKIKFSKWIECKWIIRDVYVS